MRMSVHHLASPISKPLPLILPRTLSHLHSHDDVSEGHVVVPDPHLCPRVATGSKCGRLGGHCWQVLEVQLCQLTQLLVVHS